MCVFEKPSAARCLPCWNESSLREPAMPPLLGRPGRRMLVVGVDVVLVTFEAASERSMPCAWALAGSTVPCPPFRCVCSRGLLRARARAFRQRQEPVPLFRW